MIENNKVRDELNLFVKLDAWCVKRNHNSRRLPISHSRLTAQLVDFIFVTG